MNPGAGEPSQSDIPGDHQLLSQGWLTGKTEAGRPLSLMHHSVTGQGGQVTSVGRNHSNSGRLTHPTEILQCPTQDRRILHRPIGVGEEADPEIDELGIRSQRCPFAAHGEGGGRNDLTRRRLGQSQDLSDGGGRVGTRHGVGGGDNGCVATEGGGPTTGLDRAGCFKAGLAEMGVQIDQAGYNRARGGIEYPITHQ